MKFARLFSTIVVCVAALSTFALAQTAPHAPAHKHLTIAQRLEKLDKALNLTPDQDKSIKKILQSQQAQAKAIHKNASLTPDQKKTQLKELGKTTRSSINDVLTPEQRAKLKALRPHKVPTAPAKP